MMQALTKGCPEYLKGGLPEERECSDSGTVLLIYRRIQMAGCICEQCVSGLHRVSHVCIGSSWIFRDLEPEEKTALASAAIRRLFKRGDVIFSQDEVADRMFLIKAGRIKISKVTEDGNELILDIRKEGDFLGEQIFWDDFRYPGTAACIEDTYICGFNRQSFEKLVMENPGIGLSVIKKSQQAHRIS
ncbi:MAG: cyclic nucleotide-binding domain-containing protein [Geovibrio sp.]|nr:cyclic nucleotide-binding domain-containing protein [Geovibrio sp.]